MMPWPLIAGEDQADLRHVHLRRYNTLVNDRLLIVIALLLITTVGVWLVGWFPYPFGILVLLAALIMRLIQISADNL